MWDIRTLGMRVLDRMGRASDYVGILPNPR